MVPVFTSENSSDALIKREHALPGSCGIPWTTAILLLVLLTGIFYPRSVFAGGVADFGTVSKSKITLNPAGAAAIDRILVDLTAFQFEQGNTLSPLSDQVRTTYGSPGDLYFETPAGYRYHADTIKYDDGEVTGGHLDLAYPAKYFTLGIGRDDRNERYKNGRYYSSYMSDAVFNSQEPVLKSSFTRVTNSFLLAIPMRGFSLGIRQNYREITYETSNLQNVYPGYWVPDYNVPYLYNMSASKISGKASYQFNDYGIMLNLSAHQPKLDIGYLIRPPTEAVMKFDPAGISSDGPGFTMADMPFTEPGLNLTTIAFGMGAGRAMAQIILEAGDYVDADHSFQALIQPGTSRRNRAYDIDAYLLRLTINPFFEVAYGVRNQEIAGSLTNIESQMIKFPIPMGDTLVLTIGRQTLTVLDQNDETVTKGTSYSIAAEMKFGKPVSGPGRGGGSITGRGLPPKTKRLPYYMEY